MKIIVRFVIVYLILLIKSTNTISFPFQILSVYVLTLCFLWAKINYLTYSMSHFLRNFWLISVMYWTVYQPFISTYHRCDWEIFNWAGVKLWPLFQFFFFASVLQLTRLFNWNPACLKLSIYSSSSFLLRIDVLLFSLSPV